MVAPRDQGEYVLDTDASDHALGVVLHQRQDGYLKVIAYASRSLTAPERRYCITRRELLGVIFSLRKFRQHLLGRRVTVRTDHATLTYLMRTPEPIGQQGQWQDFLAEFDLNIVHRAGKNHSRPCERETGEECPQIKAVLLMHSKKISTHREMIWWVKQLSWKSVCDHSETVTERNDSIN